MNYYPFHIGDYASATRHLSWDEDAAYRRLLDVYYVHEQPLPADKQRVFRLVLATNKAQRDAVESVLDEFFSLHEDGWHNERADAEIAEMLDKQVEKDERKGHEKDRMRRHRERRAALFETLRVHGIVPAWDISMRDLQRLHDTHCNGPETDLKREQVVIGDAPATAIPIPIPTPTPTPSKKQSAPAARHANPAKPDGVSQGVWDDFCTMRKKQRADVTETAIEGIAREAKKAGLRLEAALQMCCARGWRGFNADWVDKRQSPHTVPPQGTGTYGKTAPVSPEQHQENLDALGTIY